MLTSTGALCARGSFSDVEKEPSLSILDVETTGLDPAFSRVVECAVVTCSSEGELLEEWSSLISVPGADEIGAGWLHGITRSTLEEAPGFAEVAGEIAERLRNTVVVGHVVAFDLSHLRAEFRRIGAAFPDLEGASVCTREVALACLPSGSRTLAAVCARLGVVREDAHTA
ncbi:MAG: 3'-5' exonuclease, partial [Acidimicrobiales bacterium]